MSDFCRGATPPYEFYTQTQSDEGCLDAYTGGIEEEEEDEEDELHDSDEWEVSEIHCSTGYEILNNHL